MASFQEDFIGAVKAGGHMRKRAFDYWAERHGDKFANGEKGYKFYCDLLEEVKKAGDPKAVEEYQKRFIELCDQDVVKAKVFGAFIAAGEDAEKRINKRERQELEELRRLKNAPKKGFFARLFGR
jgi:hypothetical protein